MLVFKVCQPDPIARANEKQRATLPKDLLRACQVYLVLHENFIPKFVEFQQVWRIPALVTYAADVVEMANVTKANTTMPETWNRYFESLAFYNSGAKE